MARSGPSSTQRRSARLPTAASRQGGRCVAGRALGIICTAHCLHALCSSVLFALQGKAALVQHFQNSSLLHEDKRCRPILFSTQGDLAGEPETFPNAS